MKTISLLLTLSVILFCSCHDDDPPAPINCNGIVTDTTGTNDTARLYIATGFSPNNDGIDDVFRPITKGVANYEFTLYDVNNNVVYTSQSFGSGNFSPATASGYIKYYYKMQATTNQGHHIGECGELYAMSCLPQGIQASSLKFEVQLTQAGFTGTNIDPVIQSNCQ